MTEEKKYREGNEEDNESIQGDEKKERYEVAFVVAKTKDGNLLAISDLGGLEVSRKPSIREVRDLCAMLAKDINNDIISQESAKKVAREIAEAIANQSVRNMVNNKSIIRG